MAQQPELKHAAVLGWPISHSLSPRLHNYWMKQYNITGNYEAIAVAEQDLQLFLQALPKKKFTGVNLTIPHKEKALLLMDEIDGVARRIGAVNTITVKNGKLYGTNTDAYGFIANMKAQMHSHTKGTAMVLGAGGAARAICAGLLDDGWHVCLAARTRNKAETIAAHFKDNITIVDWQERAQAMADISMLVNTTPLGMKGQSPLDISLEKLSPGASVYEIIYNPLETLLIAEARKRGHAVITGLGMLLYQAQPAFEAWFGVKPEVTPALEQYMQEALI